MRRGIWLGVAGVVAMLVCAPSVTAATQIGQISPDGTNTCVGFAAPYNLVQDSVTSGTSYEVPAGGGVITEWRHWGANTNPGSGRLQVWRQLSAPSYTLVGRSDTQTFTAGVENVFATRIPVSGGDRLGLRTASAECLISGDGTGAISLQFPPNPDPAPGDNRTMDGVDDERINVAAILEPDCDNDGLGDETQDDNLLACDATAPGVAITKGPKDKTKNRQAKFEFTGTDARAIASFQCSLDGAGFTTCASPMTVNVKKGKHTFAVRATDEAGNVGTPATDEWKRKKKRKN